MLKGTIYHNGHAIAPGSEAYRLKTEGKTAALDKHLAATLEAAHKRGEIRRPEKKKMTTAELYASLKAQVTNGNYMNADDVKALEHVKEDRIKVRILVERAIVRALAVGLFEMGAELTMDNGEYVTKCKDLTALMEEVGACDEEVLRVKFNGQCGFFLLVYGNDGWDVIADNSLWVEDLDHVIAIGNMQEDFAAAMLKDAK